MGKNPSRPRSPAGYEAQQDRLTAAYDAKQDQIAERKAGLLETYGDHFADKAKLLFDNLHYDDRTIGYAVDSMAQQYAELGTMDLSQHDTRTHQKVGEQAFDVADAKGQADRQADEKKWALGYEQATQEVGKPNRDAEPSRKPPPPGPEFGAEKVETREPVRSYKDLTREHAEIVAKLEAGEELRPDYGTPESKEEREQGPAQTYAGLKAEQSLAAERGEERGGLEFFENRKGEDRDVGSKDRDKSDDRQGSLEFYETRNPPDPKGPGGPDFDP